MPADAKPDVWACRRVDDFPAGKLPAAAAHDACALCRAPIVYNPARTEKAPRICMQCAGIEPGPIA